MKKAEGLQILKALKKADINGMSKEDQFATLDMIVALSDEAEALGKIEQAAKEKLIPKGFEQKSEKEQAKEIPDINKKLNDYLNPYYNAESEVKILTITEDGLSKIVSSKDLNTVEKAIIYKHLRICLQK